MQTVSVYRILDLFEREFRNQEKKGKKIKSDKNDRLE